MNIAQVNASNFSNADTATAIYMITEENKRRAALTPPGTPLLLDTAQNQKSSYETILTATLLTAHLSYVTQAAEANATAKQIIQLLKSATPPTQSQLNNMLAAGTA